MNRVVIFGASGFVGTAAFDLLSQSSDWEVVPVIHSTGNAWDLGRRGVKMRTADLMEPSQIDDVLEGCTHVVNCTRGPAPVMTKGLTNLVNSCRKAGVSRFVHLSSVAVYGDPPRPESHSELAEPKIDNSYAQVKLDQDIIVEKAARRGLSSVVLCPPNISGAGSDFIVDMIEALRHGSFALVEGSWPVNLVDVRNLAAAVAAALTAPAGGVDDGQRLFVTDGEHVDWASLAASLADMAGVDVRSVPGITEDAARDAVPRAAKRTGSALGSLKHLMSGTVRAALREDPYLARADKAIRKLVPGMLEERMRYWLNGPIRVPVVYDDDGLDVAWQQLQLRGVAHDCRRARESIGYTPILSFQESIDDFRNWYRTYHGWASVTWPRSLELSSV